MPLRLRLTIETDGTLDGPHLSGVGQGDGIQQPIVCLSHNARLPDFYVAIVYIVIVNEYAAFEGDDAALLKAECPKLDANPDDGRAGRLPNLDDAERLDTDPVHTHRAHATGKAVG